MEGKAIAGVTEGLGAAGFVVTTTDLGLVPVKLLGLDWEREVDQDFSSKLLSPVVSDNNCAKLEEPTDC
jgi:hypothetical protein